MIAIDHVIGKIAQATRGDREIDYMIALVMGWKRIEKEAPGTGRQSRPLWLVPSGKEEAKVPTYTSNLQEAYMLALQVAPHTPAGCAWERHQASAQIEGQPPFIAATPILALCGASLTLKKAQMS
jgi:hypothetical protein